MKVNGEHPDFEPSGG